MNWRKCSCQADATYRSDEGLLLLSLVAASDQAAAPKRAAAAGSGEAKAVLPSSTAHAQHCHPLQAHPYLHRSTAPENRPEKAAGMKAMAPRDASIGTKQATMQVLSRPDPERHAQQNRRARMSTRYPRPKQCDLSQAVLPGRRPRFMVRGPVDSR